MKKNNKNFVKLLKAKIIACRKMQDYMTGKGNYERADYYKKMRWNYEDVLDIFTKKAKFDEEVRMHEIELEEIEERGL